MQLIKPGSKVDDFLILRLIARGGMGEVYEAYEQTLDRKVALKIVSQKAENAADMSRRFKREARILAKVNHPNIVTVYSIKSVDDLQYLAMELVDGVSFKDFLSEFTLPLPMALNLFQRSLAAVQVVHNLNIIHRDLKPGNILFDKNGDIKILDFGIAQFNGSDSDKGVVVGSPPYMAPELTDGYTANWYTECWSLGAILYELLTRQMIYHRVVEGALVLNDGDRDMIPAPLVEIIEKACAKDSKLRYQNSDEFVAALNAVSATLTDVSEQHKLRLQAQVKELLNRARCMIETEIQKMAMPQATMIGSPTMFVPPPMPKVPLGTEDFSSSTIVHKKPTIPDQPAKQYVGPAPSKKPASMMFYAVPAVAVVLGAGYFFFGSKLHVSMDSMSSTAPKAKTEEPLKVPKAALEEKKAEVKAETKVEVANLPETGNQPLSPLKDEAIFTEKRKVDFKWSQNLKAKQFKLEVANDVNFDEVVLSQAVSGTNFTWKKQLKPGLYNWRISSGSGKNVVSAFANSFLVLEMKPIQIESPDKNSEFTMLGNDPAKVTFKWGCKSGIDQYQIEIASDAAFTKSAGSVVDKECSWSTTLAEGEYFWRVKAAKPVGDQNFVTPGVPFKVTKKNAPTAKMATSVGTPTLLEPTVTRVLGSSRSPAGEESFELKWKSIKDAASYQYQVAKDKAFNEIVTDKKVTADKVNYAVTTPGTTYYRVRAVATDGSTSPFSRMGQMNAFVAAPEIAKAFNFTIGQGLSLVEWKPVSAVKNYLVQLAKNADFSDATNHSVTGTNLEIPGGAGNYFVRVAAADTRNEMVSDFSSIAKVKIMAAKPKAAAVKLLSPRSGAKAPTRNGQISIEFSWKPAPGTAKYVLEISSDEKFSDVIERVESNESRFLVEKISHTGRIFWRVKPEAGSDWSEPFHLDLL